MNVCALHLLPEKHLKVYMLINRKMPKIAEERKLKHQVKNALEKLQLLWIEVFSWVISNSFHFSHVCWMWLNPCSVRFLFSSFFEVSRVVVPTSKDFDTIWFQGWPVDWLTLRLDFMWQIGSHSNHQHPVIPHGHSSLSAFEFLSKWSY